MINFKNASYKLTLVSHFRFVSFWNCVANEYKRTYIGCSVGKQCVKSTQNSLILSEADDADMPHKARYLITKNSSHMIFIYNKLL